MSITTIIDGIGMASPCWAHWDEMKGTNRSHFCSECGKDVYHISAITLYEAAPLIARPRKRHACVYTAGPTT